MPKTPLDSSIAKLSAMGPVFSRICAAGCTLPRGFGIFNFHRRRRDSSRDQKKIAKRRLSVVGQGAFAILAHSRVRQWRRIKAWSRMNAIFL